VNYIPSYTHLELTISSFAVLFFTHAQLIIIYIMVEVFKKFKRQLKAELQEKQDLVHQFTSTTDLYLLFSVYTYH